MFGNRATVGLGPKFHEFDRSLCSEVDLEFPIDSPEVGVDRLYADSLALSDFLFTSDMKRSDSSI